MRLNALAAAVVLACPLILPHTVRAVQTLDDFRFPESGAYPAYPASSAETGRNLHLFVYGGAYRDSNLFRLPASGTPQSDTWLRLGVGLRADVPVSRQRFTLDAQIDDNRFDKFSQLNNTGTRARGTWLWEAAGNLSGDLGVAREHAMAGFGQVQAITTNEMTQTRGFGSANWMITPSWRLRGAFNAQEFEAENSARAMFNNEQTDVIVGVDYVSGLENSIGVQMRDSRGEFPNQQVVTPAGVTTISSHYKEREPAIAVHYNLGGKSSVDARLGHTKRTHEQLPARDYKGSTGSVTFHWTPTPRIMLDATAYRETRAFVTSALGTVLTTIDSAASYVVARGIRFEPRWALTNEITLQLQLLEERDTFKADPTLPIGSPEREDKFRAGVIGAGWSPLRALLLTLSFERGKRTSNIVNRDFKYDAVSLNARWTFF
jgi:exopolysaccharide biosynthesis operon protein EpsL